MSRRSWIHTVEIETDGGRTLVCKVAYHAGSAQTMYDPGEPASMEVVSAEDKHTGIPTYLTDWQIDEACELAEQEEKKARQTFWDSIDEEIDRRRHTNDDDRPF